MKNLSSEYLAYIEGPEWTARKREFYATHEKACAACGGKRRIQLHHLTYARLGFEDDGDLMPLCHPHHQAVDNFSTPGVSIAEATRLMIEWVNSDHPFDLPPVKKPVKKNGQGKAKKRKTKPRTVRIPMTDEYRKITCPTCGAGPGKECDLGLNTVHASRSLLYRRVLSRAVPITTPKK